MTKPLSYLNDILCIESATFNIKRNDELSGDGSGRFWQAELAPPIWECTINVAPQTHDDAKQITSRIRALEGSKDTFLLTDPISREPQFDKNRTFAGMTSRISSISQNGKTISISGLPQGFNLTFGDKFSIVYGVDSDRYSFHEIVSDVVAGSNGQALNVSVFPFIPPAILVNDIISLYDAACKMIIYPDTFTSGTSSFAVTSGISFRAIQKK